jgi:hypothetical protein
LGLYPRWGKTIGYNDGTQRVTLNKRGFNLSYNFLFGKEGTAWEKRKFFLRRVRVRRG